MMELILEASHINGGFHATTLFGLGKTTKFSLGFALGTKSWFFFFPSMALDSIFPFLKKKKK